jgi:alpha-glucosidase
VKKTVIAALAALAAPMLAANAANAADFPTALVSPDRQIVVTLAQGGDGQLTYSIERKGETIITPSVLRVTLAEGDLGSVEVQETKLGTGNAIRKLVATKAAEARDHYNELTITAKPRSGAAGRVQWIFRAYDDGVAFRFVVPADAGLKTLSVRNEETRFMFGANYACHGFNVWRMDTSHEGEFDPVPAKHIREHTNYDLPLVCRTGKNAFAIAEANLVDYGGLYLAGQGTGSPGLETRVARRLDDKSLIARVDIGPNGAGSPWRVVMLGDKLGKLIDSNLIGNLNPDPSFDTRWIKAGKTAWDWWSGPYLPPPDKGGTDMKTIKHYIDFAGRSGFEYMMIDEGWCLHQQIVDYYHRLMRKAAEHELLVDMHGAYPPAGLNRTYPNYLTQEGIMGAEYNKWSRRVTATHNVSLAYTRMLLGPVDYTPGGFRNRTPATFEVVNSPPQVQTTRGHGLAMFVVYESPFQMVADSPDAYENAPGYDFVKMVPAAWDETRFLAGDIDEFVVVARRRGNDWYIGAMGTEGARAVSLPLAFLGEGNFGAKIWQDGATPTTLDESERTVKASDTIELKLAPSGGAAVKLTRGK